MFPVPPFDGVPGAAGLMLPASPRIQRHTCVEPIFTDLPISGQSKHFLSNKFQIDVRVRRLPSFE